MQTTIDKETRTCKECGKTLPIEEFYRVKNYYMNFCRPCELARRRAANNRIRGRNNKERAYKAAETIAEAVIAANAAGVSYGYYVARGG